MTTIETDYLVVGAGASGMAFVDTLITERPADVVMVDRRHAPGGHWVDSYPFVRLHQPSANYGVNSRALGMDSIDTTGPNAGFYEQATGIEIRDYYQDVLDEHLLPSGRVRFYGMHDYIGDWTRGHAITSRLTGRTTTVKVRRKLVDSTYLAMQLPGTHTRPFSVEEDARVIPVGDLVDVTDAPSGYTIIGSGKTGSDAVNWLVQNGVDPDRIRWIKPREPWLFDRAAFQPRDLVAQSFEALSYDVEALAEAENLKDLFARLEAHIRLVRVDPTVTPTMFRGATLSRTEREELEQISNVVRLGKVRHVGADRIVLDGGEIPTNRRHVHVDCSAYGLGPAPARPVFEPGRIIIQTLMGGFVTFNAALLGYIEGTRDDDAEKNRLCEPVAPPSRDVDWITMMCGGFRSFAVHAAERDIAEWMSTSRLNLTVGLSQHVHDPRVQAAIGRYGSNMEAALKNGERLYAKAQAA